MDFQRSYRGIGGIHLYHFSRNNPSYFYDISGLEFNAQTIYDNDKIRIDCETYDDKSGKVTCTYIMMALNMFGIRRKIILYPKVGKF